MLQSGDYVVILRGVDDVSDGQLCRVLAPDESTSPHRYPPASWIPVFSWTGYVAWTNQENLVRIAVNVSKIEPLFQFGFSRTKPTLLQF